MEKDDEGKEEEEEEEEDENSSLVFPGMAFFQRRRKTLNALTELGIRRDDVARAGFFKDEDWDLKCFCCGLILPFPQLNKNVFNLHNDLSPECLFGQMLA